MTETKRPIPDPQRLQDLHFDPTAESGIRLFGDSVPDHFSLFGLPQRMLIDEAGLRDCFLDLSRRFHPDFHGGASPALRSEVLRRSSLINNAYRTLRDFPKRVDYLLNLLAPSLESNRNAVPPALLEEMFEIQEAGEALKVARKMADAGALEAAEVAVAPLRQQVQATRTNLEAALTRQASHVDSILEHTTGSSGVEELVAALKNVRLTLDHLNYLRTVIRNLH